MESKNDTIPLGRHTILYPISDGFGMEPGHRRLSQIDFMAYQL